MGIKQQLELVFYRAYADLKAEAERSYLGFLWWIIEPVFYLAAFYVLFVFILNRGGNDFVSFFLCGVIVWKWFDSAIKGGGQSISAHGGLIQQVYVPKYIFVVGAIIGCSVRFFPVFIILLLFLYFQQALVVSEWYYIMPVMMIQLFFVTACSLIVGVFVPFFPDLKIVVDNVLLAMFFLSGIFFDVHEVQEPVQTYLMWNPMLVIIDAYRDVMLRGEIPQLYSLAWIWIVSVSIILVSICLYRIFDLKYSKVRF